MRIIDLYVLIVLCVLSTYAVFSQSNTQKGRYNTLNGTYWDSDRPGNSIMISSSKDKPVFYLDSVQINRENYYINPESIVSIEVRNESPNKLY